MKKVRNSNNEGSNGHHDVGPFFDSSSRHYAHQLDTPFQLFPNQFDYSIQILTLPSRPPITVPVFPVRLSFEETPMKKDPHADEPTAEMDRVTYTQYLEAQSNAAAWKKESERLMKLLDEQIGDAYAGTIDGHKLVTHRPEQRWSVRQLVQDYPELTAHYMKKVVVDEFEMEEFRKAHQDIADKYRVRSFRTLPPKDTFEES